MACSARTLPEGTNHFLNISAEASTMKGRTYSCKIKQSSDQTNNPRVLNTVNHIFNLGPPSCLWMLQEGNISGGILNVAPDLCRMRCTSLCFIFKAASDYLGFICHCCQSEMSLRIKVDFHHHYAINHLILCLYALEKVLYFSCKW